MQIIKQFDQLPEDLRGGVIAVGNFDGVHRGHMAVVGEAGRIARANQLPWLVMTFEPHPRELFKPGGPAYRITPFPAKARIIGGLGVDGLVVPTFDRAFSMLSANEFIKTVLVDGVRARHVVSGYDFSFGHDRQGSCGLLLGKGREYGFDFTAVSAVNDAGGEIYSSTRARALISKGDMHGAATLLARPYEIAGTVITGDQLGRTIGVPTANVEIGDYIRPAYGVYAVLTTPVNSDGKSPHWMPGVANIGNRPTVDGTRELLEVHLFNQNVDLYGKVLRVKLLDYLRPELKFDGLDALKSQIANDIKKAKVLLANGGATV